MEQEFADFPCGSFGALSFAFHPDHCCWAMGEVSYAPVLDEINKRVYCFPLGVNSCPEDAPVKRVCGEDIFSASALASDGSVAYFQGFGKCVNETDGESVGPLVNMSYYDCPNARRPFDDETVTVKEDSTQSSSDQGLVFSLIIVALIAVIATMAALYYRNKQRKLQVMQDGALDDNVAIETGKETSVRPLPFIRGEDPIDTKIQLQVL